MAFGRLALGLSGLFLAVTAQPGGSDWFPCPELYFGTLQAEEVPTDEEYVAALQALDVEELRGDMTKLLTTSQPCWPADFDNYVGLFSRLSWHAAGTFRSTDGRGGTGGGRQRFDPEASWEDNTNLDKARALLVPLKRKHGAGLSWGDLIALAGTHAMWHQGAPLTEFCFGRLDEPDGNQSLSLGPGPLQEEVAPCAGPAQGACQERPNETALAAVQVGLIYVNPEGPMGVPDPAGSARDIRAVFEKMGADARATVALIGGGHAFGKAHGACSDREHGHPAGLPPNQAREAKVHPYVGTCPAVGQGTTGTGRSAWTSGLEGPWTSTPTQWSNEFFVYLVDKEWELWTGPGGHYQWRLRDQPDDPRMRFTSDMALLADPEFRRWAEVFARNATALDEAFDEAWRNLMTAGGGWSSRKRCVQLGPPPEDPAGPSRMLDTDMGAAAGEATTASSGSQGLGAASLAAVVSLAAQLLRSAP